MPKVTEIFVFVAIESKSDEGIMGFKDSDGQWHPMICSEMSTMRSLTPIANRIAKRSGKKYKILKYLLAEEIYDGCK
jgi:hypothetical protein